MHTEKILEQYKIDILNEADVTIHRENEVIKVEVTNHDAGRIYILDVDDQSWIKNMPGGLDTPGHDRFHFKADLTGLKWIPQLELDDEEQPILYTKEQAKQFLDLVEQEFYEWHKWKSNS